MCTLSALVFSPPTGKRSGSMKPSDSSSNFSEETPIPGAQRSDYWLGSQGRLTEPMVQRPNSGGAGRLQAAAHEAAEAGQSSIRRRMGVMRSHQMVNRIGGN